MRDLGGFVVAVLHGVVTSGIQGVRWGPSNAARQDKMGAAVIDRLVGGFQAT
jgi:hypothetical protein